MKRVCFTLTQLENQHTLNRMTLIGFPSKCLTFLSELLRECATLHVFISYALYLKDPLLLPFLLWESAETHFQTVKISKTNFSISSILTWENPPQPMNLGSSCTYLAFTFRISYFRICIQIYCWIERKVLAMNSQMNPWSYLNH